MSLLAPLIAFVVTALAVFPLTALAGKINLYDHPDGRRKDHGAPVPLVGGLAIALGVVLASGLPVLTEAWIESSEGHGFFVLALLGFLLLGFWDDLHEPPALVRFVLEALLVVALLVSARVEVDDLGPLLGGTRPLVLGPLAAPLSLVMVLGFVNAVNFLDGVDGLAAGITVTIWLWLLILAAFLRLHSFVNVASLWLAAVLAYLPFNLGLAPKSFPRIFLGDAGSLLLGASIASFALLLHRQATGVVGAPPAMVYAWILGYPVVDALVVIARRLAVGRNPARPDRTHLHHLLLDRGISQRGVTALLTGLAFLYGAVGFLGWWLFGLGDVDLFILFLLAMALQASVVFVFVRLSRGPRVRPLRSVG